MYQTTKPELERYSRDELLRPMRIKPPQVYQFRFLQDMDVPHIGIGQ